MRGTFDRLVGPVAIRRREPHQSVGVLGTTAIASVTPVEFGRWKVIAGRHPTPQSAREIAECSGANDTAVARSATRLGLATPSWAVDAERAGRLIHAIRDGLAAPEERPLRDPLIVYRPGEDPRPMWKTHVDPRAFSRDRADDIADAIAWCLRALAAQNGSAEWETRASLVARDWLPLEGIARLYRLSLTAAKTKPALEASAWVPIFAFALLRAGTKVKDARVLWHALAVCGPLLLAMADLAGAGSSGKVRVDVLVEDVQQWTQLAAEADAWLGAIYELSAFDDELLEFRRYPKSGRPTTGGIRSAVQDLHEALLGTGVTLQHRLHDLEATDTDGIRAVLEDVLAERLAAAGIDSQTPPGTLIGLAAAVFLSVRAAFNQGACVVCGRRTQGRKWRCVSHLRALWRDRKRRQRGARVVPRKAGAASSARGRRSKRVAGRSRVR